MPSVVTRFCRWAVLSLYAATLLLLAAIGFGISPSDANRLSAFVRSVDRSRANPEFRQVGNEYVRTGSAAMQTAVLGIPARIVIHTLRRIPGLPERLAATDRLALHYEHFSQGPLSAYLHLAAQQGVQTTTGMIQTMWSGPAISDDDIRTFLQSFDVWPAVVTDHGALASTRKLLADMGTTPTFSIIRPIDQLVRPYIDAMATEKGWPTEIERLTVAQQHAILDQLDNTIRQADFELWRTKQVNDFLNGIWGQTFGRSYGSFARGVLTARRVCQVGCLAALAMGIVLWRRRRTAPVTPPHPRPAQA